MYRPYWRRHPWQRRAYASLLLPLYPLAFTIYALWDVRDEFIPGLRGLINAIKD